MKAIKCKKQDDRPPKNYCLKCGFLCLKCSVYHSKIYNDHLLHPITEQVISLYHATTLYEQEKGKTTSLLFVKQEVNAFINHLIDESTKNEKKALAKLSKIQKNVDYREKQQMNEIIKESSMIPPNVSKIFSEFSDELTILECKAKSNILQGQFSLNPPLAFNANVLRLIEVMMGKQFANTYNFLLSQRLEDILLLVNEKPIVGDTKLNWESIVLLAKILNAIVRKNKNLYLECNAYAGAMSTTEIYNLAASLENDNSNKIENAFKFGYHKIANSRLKFVSDLLCKIIGIDNSDLQKSYTTRINYEIACIANSTLHSLMLLLCETHLSFILTQLYKLDLPFIIKLYHMDLQNAEYNKMKNHLKLLENIKLMMIIYLENDNQVKSLESLKMNIGISNESIIPNIELFEQYIQIQEGLFGNWSNETQMELTNALKFCNLVIEIEEADKKIEIPKDISQNYKECYKKIKVCWANMLQNSILGYESLPLFNKPTLHELMRCYKLKGLNYEKISERIEGVLYQCSTMLLYKIFDVSHNQNIVKLQQSINKANVHIENGLLTWSSSKHNRRLIFLYGNIDVTSNQFISDNYIESAKKIIRSNSQILKININSKQTYKQNVEIIKAIEHLVFHLPDVQIIILFQFERFEECDCNYILLKHLHYKISFIQIPFEQNYSLSITTLKNTIPDRIMILSFLQAITSVTKTIENEESVNTMYIYNYILQSKPLSLIITENLLKIFHPHKLTYDDLYNKMINDSNTYCIYNNFKQIEAPYFRQSIKRYILLEQSGVIDCIYNCILAEQNVDEAYLKFIFNEIIKNDIFDQFKTDGLLKKRYISYSYNRKCYSLRYPYSLNIYNRIVGGESIQLASDISNYKKYLMKDLSNMFKENTKMDMCYFIDKGSELKLEKHIITVIYMVLSAIPYFKEVQPTPEETIIWIRKKCANSTIKLYDKYIANIAKVCLNMLNIAVITNDNILMILLSWMHICRHDSEITTSGRYEDIYFIAEAKLLLNLYDNNDRQYIISEIDDYINIGKIEPLKLDFVKTKNKFYYRLMLYRRTLTCNLKEVIQNFEIIFANLIEASNIDVTENINQLSTLLQNVTESSKKDYQDAIMDKIWESNNICLPRQILRIVELIRNRQIKFTMESNISSWVIDTIYNMCMWLLYKILNNHITTKNSNIDIESIIQIIFNNKNEDENNNIISLLLSATTQKALIEGTYICFNHTAKSALHIVPNNKLFEKYNIVICQLITEKRLTSKKVNWIIKPSVRISCLILVFGELFLLNCFDKKMQKYLDLIENEWKSDKNYILFKSFIKEIEPLLDFSNVFDQIVFSVIIQICSILFKYTIIHWDNIDKECMLFSIDFASLEIEKIIGNSFWYCARGIKHNHLYKVNDNLKELKFNILICVEYFCTMQASNMDEAGVDFMNILSYMYESFPSDCYSNYSYVSKCFKNNIQKIKEEKYMSQYRERRKKLLQSIYGSPDAKDDEIIGHFTSKAYHFIHLLIVYNEKPIQQNVLNKTTSFEIILKNNRRNEANVYPALLNLEEVKLMKTESKRCAFLKPILAKFNAQYSKKLSIADPLLSQSINAIFTQTETQNIIEYFNSLDLPMAFDNMTLKQFMEFVKDIENKCKVLNAQSKITDEKWKKLESYFEKIININKLPLFFQNIKTIEETDIKNIIEKYKNSNCGEVENMYDLGVISDIINSDILWINQTTEFEQFMLSNDLVMNSHNPFNKKEGFSKIKYDCPQYIFNCFMKVYKENLLDLTVKSNAFESINTIKRYNILSFKKFKYDIKKLNLKLNEMYSFCVDCIFSYICKHLKKDISFSNLKIKKSFLVRMLYSDIIYDKMLTGQSLNDILEGNIDKDYFYWENKSNDAIRLEVSVKLYNKMNENAISITTISIKGVLWVFECNYMSNIYRLEFRLYHKEAPETVNNLLNMLLNSNKNDFTLRFTESLVEIKISKARTLEFSVDEINKLIQDNAKGRLFLVKEDNKKYLKPKLIISLTQLDKPDASYICIGELISSNLKSLISLNSIPNKGAKKIGKKKIAK